ncbi:MAG: hypothetical protein MJZ82_03170 [Paludibacteraceae bacterium]|nr:hypothetical protein [Paludibacteraceae bacterium]
MKKVRLNVNRALVAIISLIVGCFAIHSCVKYGVPYDIEEEILQHQDSLPDQVADSTQNTEIIR